MRILFGVHTFPPVIYGGADLYTYELAKLLVARGHKVTVFCASKPLDQKLDNDDFFVKHYDLDGIQVVNVWLNYSKQKDPFGVLLLLNPITENVFRTTLEDFRPDVVHITAFDHITPSILLPAHQRGIPIIVTLTGSWPICPKTTQLHSSGNLCGGVRDGYTCATCILGTSRLLKAMAYSPPQLRPSLVRLLALSPRARRIGSISLMNAVEERNKIFPDLLQKVDAVLSPSKCYVSIFEAIRMFGDKPIQFSPHGHATEVAVSGRNKIPSQRIRFGFTGQLVKHKGVAVLLDAFINLKPLEAVELLLYGDDRFEPQFVQELRDKAKAHPNIKFCGPYGHHEVGQILQNIDVVVMPSLKIENAPLVIAEANAALTPVIGSTVCGVAEWIEDGIDGLQFERGNAEDLRRKMQLLIDNPERISQMSANAPTVRTIADESEYLMQLYEILVASAANRAFRSEY